MEMFLMALTLSLFGVAVCAALFAAATRGVAPADPAPRRKAVTAPMIAPARFFADHPVAAPPSIPIEVLVLQLERHIRLEQAAAERFLVHPTRESLHSSTVSPLVH